MSVPAAARAAFSAWRAEVRQNFYDTDPHLASLLRHYDRAGAEPDLRRFGETCLTLDGLAHELNRDENLPRLRAWSDQGDPTHEVVFHPAYHEAGRLVYGSGVMARYREPGRELETLALAYLLGMNGEAGHACPLACTAGLIKILGRHGERFAPWLARLTDPDPSRRWHGAQFLTEVQGGADVGANVVQALDADEPGQARLVGEKWFCSVVDAPLFLVTARAPGGPDGTRGVRAYVVPRHLPDGRPNAFRVRRLKAKLGTRSMASGEVDFEGALGHDVGDFKETVEVVLNTSRLFNAVVGAGSLHRAFREAHAYARHRRAFDRPLVDFPAVRRKLATLRAEAYAARSVSFLLAHLSDRLATGQGDAALRDAFRMLVNLNKLWVSHATTGALRDAIEVLGGNGAIEEFSVLPRLLRDSIVCEQWEGPHEVLAAQLLRDSRQRHLHEPMFEHLERLAGPDAPAVIPLRATWQRLLDSPPAWAELHARDVIAALRAPVQALVLAAEGRTPGSDPRLPAVVAHLRALHRDPLDDDDLDRRIEALLA